MNARPNGVFDSEVFSTWSYVTHYGNWTSPHGWVPGGFADVAHKNGVGVSGVASIPNAGISANDGAWGQALNNQPSSISKKSSSLSTKASAIISYSSSSSIS